VSPEPNEFAASVVRNRQLTGWVLASVLLLAVTGVAHVAMGSASLSGEGALAASSPPWGSLRFWSLIWLALGAGQLLSALLIWRCNALGLLVGVMLSVCLMFVWFVNYTYLPLVAVVLAATSGLALYSLLACDGVENSRPSR
jgi:hypothetical protein